MSDTRDEEQNRLAGRLRRYANVGANVGGIAARMAGARLFGLELDRGKSAAELAAALGGLKGPIMKVAQLLSTIPEALPSEYAAELSQLQSQAPPMGSAFVRRRMAAELGPNWPSRFESFSGEAAASASLGQVHRATAPDGRRMALENLLCGATAAWAETRDDVPLLPLRETADGGVVYACRIDGRVLCRPM